MNEFRFSNRQSLLNYYRTMVSNDCPVSFDQVIDHSGFDFYGSCLEVAEQCIIDVWLRANELYKKGEPNYLKKAAMDVWRQVVVRRQNSKNPYWSVREDRDISAEELAPEEVEFETWLAEAVCQEIDARDLAGHLFKYVGIPVSEAVHRKTDSPT